MQQVAQSVHEISQPGGPTQGVWRNVADRRPLLGLLVDSGQVDTRIDVIVQRPCGAVSEHRASRGNVQLANQSRLRQ